MVRCARCGVCHAGVSTGKQASEDNMSIIPFHEWDIIVQSLVKKLTVVTNAIDPVVLIVDAAVVQSASLVVAAALLRLRCVLLHKKRSDTLADVVACTHIDRVVEYDEATDELVHRAMVPPRHAHMKDPTWTRTGVEVCVLTSGTTDNPKVVGYSWDAVWAQAAATKEGVCHNTMILCLTRAALILARAYSGVLREALVVMVTTPVSHAYNMNNILAGYLGQCTLALCMSAAEVMQGMRLLKEPGLVVLTTCPPMIRALVDEDDGMSHGAAWDHCTVYSAGSPMDVEVADAFRARYGLAVRQNYGTSETGNIAIWRTDNPQHAHDAAYKGVAWGGAEVHGAGLEHVLRAGEHGEVVVTVPWMSLGYVRDGALVAHGGPGYATGDAGKVVVDPDGAVHVFAVRRLRAPLRVQQGGLTLLLQVDEVEALYREALAARVGVVVAVTQTGAGSVHAHVALGHEPTHKDEALVTECLVRALATSHPYALPGRVFVYRALPTSPAGKTLYADMARR